MLYNLIIAFMSGLIIEALYALGVLYIGKHRKILSGSMSFIWGAVFLIGLNKTFIGPVLGTVWCLGLGLGTILGIMIEEICSS